jgi:hypothetical protein
MKSSSDIFKLKYLEPDTEADYSESINISLNIPNNE